MKTTEGNKLIAEFMKSRNRKISGFDITDLRYDSSWDWLMLVVEKIESLDDHDYDVRIEGDDCMIQNYDHSKIVADQIGFDTRSKIKTTWLAVVQFIQWYNEHK